MTTINVKSPRVTAFKWGRVDVENFHASFKDVKLYPGGAREWNWEETGTRHDPGIQPGDVQELLDNGAMIVILSKGVHQRLKTHPATLDMLHQCGITVLVLQTEAAIEAYNALVDAEPVGALIHSTC